MEKFFLHYKVRSWNLAVVAMAVLAVACVFSAGDVSASTTVGDAVSVGSTLDVTGATTLNGAVTLGNAYADNLTLNGRIASSLWASSTLYIGSAAGEEDLVVTDDAVTVGTSANSSTLAVFGATTLTGGLLPQASHNNLYDLGAYTRAWKDVYVSGTLYAGGLSLLGSERLVVTNVSSTNFTAGGYLTTDGSATLGDGQGDTITVNGQIVGLTYGSNNVFAPLTNNYTDVGLFGAAWKNVYASGTVYMATSTVISETGTSTVYAKSNASGYGSQLILEKSDGSGCIRMYFNTDGTMATSTLTCPGI